MAILHLQLCAGFANRLRALVSGLCVAEDYGLRLVIHWFPLSSECACRFSAVLDPESLPKPVKVVPEDLYQAKEVLSRDDWETVYGGWDQKSDLYIKSYGIFYSNDSWDTQLRRIKPSRLVKDFLDRRCSAVEWDNAIGIHIRRTDNQKSIAASPVEGFFQKMRDEKDAYFVVATDDKEVRKRIELEFGTRCIFPALVLSRKTEESMIQGVADFFALSKCSKIIGSAHSSFSEIAARYSGVVLYV